MYQSTDKMNQIKGRNELIGQLLAYVPFNEQEETDQAVMLDFLAGEKPVFERACLSAHMTASAWVTNTRRDRVLMAWHNLYRSWAWLGGHADGETDLLSVALREVREESGIRTVRAVTEQIFSLEILPVDGHEKKGKYVPSHLHLNVTYLLEADERESVRAKQDENQSVAWFTPDEAVERSTEPWFQERIYKKLNQKLNRYHSQLMIP